MTSQSSFISNNYGNLQTNPNSQSSTSANPAATSENLVTTSESAFTSMSLAAAFANRLLEKNQEAINLDSISNNETAFPKNETEILDVSLESTTSEITVASLKTHAANFLRKYVVNLETSTDRFPLTSENPNALSGTPAAFLARKYVKNLDTISSTSAAMTDSPAESAESPTVSAAFRRQNLMSQNVADPQETSTIKIVMDSDDPTSVSHNPVPSP